MVLWEREAEATVTTLEVSPRVVECGLLGQIVSVIKAGANFLEKVDVWGKTLVHVGGEDMGSLRNRWV